MNIVVKRCKNVNGSISGKAYINGNFYGYTLENNDYKIPVGNYTGKMHDSPKFGRLMLQVDNVPGRSYILFHGGNTKEDSKGCILIAKNKFNDEYIQGSLSDDLNKKAIDVLNRGEKINIRVVNDAAIMWLVLAVGLTTFFIIRHDKEKGTK